jgi:hypothetical protein
MNSGKLLILIILASAVTAATVAWRHQANRGQRVLELWGSQNAYLVRRAPQVRLASQGQQLDISTAPGISHARQALIVDSSYDWTATSSSTATPEWSHELTFADFDQVFTLKFDLQRRLAESNAGVQAHLGETVAEGLKVFLAEQLERSDAATR